MITFAILTGGQSRRLGGREKHLISIGGRRIIDRILYAIHKSGIDGEIIIVGTKHEGYRSVMDVPGERGALRGIKTALIHSHSERVFIIAGDMPFITPHGIRVMATIPGDTVVPVWPEGYIEPLFSIFHRRKCLHTIEKYRGMAVNEFIRMCSPYYLPVYSISPRPHVFFMNINTLNDIKRAEEIHLSERQEC